VSDIPMIHGYEEQGAPVYYCKCGFHILLHESEIVGERGGITHTYTQCSKSDTFDMRAALERWGNQAVDAAVVDVFGELNYLRDEVARLKRELDWVVSRELTRHHNDQQMRAIGEAISELKIHMANKPPLQPVNRFFAWISRRDHLRSKLSEAVGLSMPDDDDE
jgi:hypothetical protein